jgi:uncharacterized membrane protein
VDITIEEAFKLIMSLGLVVPDKEMKGLLQDNSVAESPLGS